MSDKPRKLIRKVGSGWLLPHSRLKVTRGNIALLLSRIPVADRRLIPSKRHLHKLAKEAVAKNAASIYGQQASKVFGKATFPWWNLGKGCYRKHFFRAWIGYELGFMPSKLLECAVAQCARVFRCKFPKPQQAFGPFILASLLHGWEPVEESVFPELTTSKDKIDTPVPLARAYTGPRAAERMVKAKTASRIWEPGLVFDPDRGMYVTPEEAGPKAIDVDKALEDE